MLKKKKKILFFDGEGFPHGFAAVQRMTLIARALIEAGFDVWVINRKGIHERRSNLKLKKKGTFQKINYLYASLYPFRPSNFLLRNILKFVGLLNQAFILLKLKEEPLFYSIVSTRSFASVLYYNIVSKIFGFKIIYDYVELNSSIPKTGNKRMRELNDVLFEKYVFKLVDGFFCISDYLYRFIRANQPSIPVEKIPIISDFDRCVWIKENGKIFEDYFLYCGSLDYLEVIRFILNSFSQVNQTGKVFLYLVVNGTAKQFSQLCKDFASIHSGHMVKVFRNLTDVQLSYLYSNAKALLVPIRPNKKDIARFPHKIGEYLASSAPIITTAYGEIPNYFIDNYNALIAKNYNIDSYAAKMKLVISNPALASKIWINGFQIGFKNFDYRILSHRMEAFFDNL